MGLASAAHTTPITHDNPEAILGGLVNSDLPPRIVVNSPGNDYLITSDTDVLDAAVNQAVINWNDGLRNFAPTSLNKFPFHKNPGADDPAANVRVVGYPTAEYDLRCNPGGHACVQDELVPDGDNLVNFFASPLYIIVNTSLVTTENHKRGDIAHEMGHVLFFGEHYTSLSGPCNSGYSGSYFSVMDLWECDALEGPSSHDRQDCYGAYRPQDAPASVNMTINSSSQATIGWSNSDLHNVARFFWQRETDTNGTIIDNGNTTDKFTVSKAFTGIVDGQRRCAKVQGRSGAGFVGGNDLSPRGFYGCYSRANGAAGVLLATSHRLFGSQITIRNASGGTRQINVLGPALQNVGCSPSNVGNGANYSCQAGVALMQYPDLFIVMTNTGTGANTLAAVDFE
jgi:hypothetical protein